MMIGIQKRQWLLLSFTVSVPFLLNVVAIWRDVGTPSILKMLNGSYPHPLLGFLGGPYNPLPEIFLKLLLSVVILGMLAWLSIFISNKAFFQRQLQVVKLFEIVVVALFIAAIFTIVTGFFMPLIWLPRFHTYLLGLPGSSFTTYWSRWFVFPTTATILFTAIFLSRNKTWK